MARAAPIGREHELEQLLEVVERTREGRGSVVFLSGRTGTGKSALLKELAAAVAEWEPKGRPFVASARCYETSAGNPLGPFGEVLRTLTNRDKRGDRAKRAVELVKEVAPPLVELIPVIGKLAALGIKTGAVLAVHALGDDHEAQQTQLAVGVADALQHIADDAPLVVVIDDAHWIDAPSKEVIARVANADEPRRLTLVVAYDDSLVDDGHLLTRLRADVIVRPAVLDLRLDNLTRDEVEAVLRGRYDTVPGERLADWLHDVTDGSPLFLEQYLITLEAQGVLRNDDGAWTLDGSIEGEADGWRLGGALAAAETPATLLDLLKPRLADLGDDDRSLLEMGAIQGRRFLSTVLVRMLARDEDEVVNRLEEVAEESRMIAPEEIDDWWSDRSALFAFDPGVLQELLYGRQKVGYMRRRRHRAVAQALEELIAGADPPPRQALLEIAQQYERAGDGVAAAARLVEVAESTFAEGADRETASHAAHALELLRHVPPQQATSDAGRLLARAILLVLLGGEPTWRADPANADGERLLELAAEAERAAEEADDTKLQASARYAAAFVLTAYRGLDEAIAAYREALELARAAGDAASEFAILVNYGHQLDSVDLKAGRDLLEEARELLAGGALDEQLDEARRAVEEARLDMRIGVAEFDLGDYGEALERLALSSHTLREAHTREDAAWSLAFLAQVYAAIGLYAEAEATLRDAIDLFAERRESFGVRGYLTALLGHVYVESDRPSEARELLASARKETKDSGFRAVIPLVDAYWAELLLAEGTPAALREADEALAATDSFGWARSEIARASLRARVALAERRVDDALALSTQAVSKLAECGGFVTATRSEEILFAHARILDAADSPEAARWHAEAARVVREKAASLTDPAQKDSFLQRVRLSREILAAG